MAKTPGMLPDNCPAWYNGKTINEAVFCQDFLAQYKLAHTENAFFTPEGRITDESQLKEQIFRLLEPYATTSVTKKIANIIELLKSRPARMNSCRRPIGSTSPTAHFSWTGSLLLRKTGLSAADCLFATTRLPHRPRDGWPS